MVQHVARVRSRNRRITIGLAAAGVGLLGSFGVAVPAGATSPSVEERGWSSSPPIQTNIDSTSSTIAGAETKTSNFGLGTTVGDNCVIENAIIDKNARIGDNVTISPAGKPENVDHALYFIRDGIVIIPKNGVIPHGTVI